MSSKKREDNLDTAIIVTVLSMRILGLVYMLKYSILKNYKSFLIPTYKQIKF